MELISSFIISSRSSLQSGMIACFIFSSPKFSESDSISTYFAAVFGLLLSFLVFADLANIPSIVFPPGLTLLTPNVFGFFFGSGLTGFYFDTSAKHLSNSSEASSSSLKM